MIAAPAIIVTPPVPVVLLSIVTVPAPPRNAAGSTFVCKRPIPAAGAVIAPLPPTISPLPVGDKQRTTERPRVKRAKDLRRAAGLIADQDGGGSPRNVKSGALADAEPGIGNGCRGS